VGPFSGLDATSRDVFFLSAWVYATMPTVFRFYGLRVVIYLADHRPEHVHVIGANGEAVFILNCPDGPLELRECYGFNRRRVNIITDQLTQNLALLCEKWRKIHGH
jgi:Domain of unknown function (DUF4160)